MPAPLPVCTDKSPAELRRLARCERDGRIGACLLALANALEGVPREVAARPAGVTGQTLGDWVHRYNAEGVAGLKDRPRGGRPSRRDDGQQAALKAPVLKGWRLERDGGVAWRARDLWRLAERRFGARYRENGTLGLRHGLDPPWQKARPVHPEADPKAQERFKKPARTDAGHGDPAPRGRAGRVGVRGCLAAALPRDRPEGAHGRRLVAKGPASARSARASVRLGAPVGRCPSGAGCRRGPGATGGRHGGDEPLKARLSSLAELAGALPKGTHAVLVLDRAGWHISADLRVPASPTLVHLPPRAPELNPVEKVGLDLRERWLSHRVLPDDPAILDAACTAWNALPAGPGRLRSLTRYPWLPASVTPS